MKVLPAKGANIPALGFGTWELRREECSQMVAGAIIHGYRHIDTAAMYENEREVGQGLRASGVERSEIFLTTKIWPTEIAGGDLQQSLENSIERLGVDHVDLALIHWPSKTIPLEHSIAALNDAKSMGIAANIGVSNFPTNLLRQAVELSDAPLVCNQVEHHPYLDQSHLSGVCRELGVALIAYCPLARGGELFGEPVIVQSARLYGKTPAQVVLRWHMQQTGCGAIPKTRNSSRMKENFDIFDFELSGDEMREISSLCTKNHRICDFDFSPEWD